MHHFPVCCTQILYLSPKERRGFDAVVKAPALGCACVKGRVRVLSSQSFVV